jgi:hypothetical protein
MSRSITLKPEIALGVVPTNLRFVGGLVPDAALDPPRKFGPGHGVDTTDGRDYTAVMADGLGDVARRLNNLAARGIL